MPMAGWPSAAALATTSPTRAAPSSIENSVCTCRWVKESANAHASAAVHSRSTPFIPRLGMKSQWCDSGVDCSATRPLQVGAGTHITAGSGRRSGAGRQLAPHPLELLAGGHLLGEERRLDAVEQALQPAHELGLGDPQLHLGGRASLAEGEGQAAQLLLQIG